MGGLFLCHDVSHCEGKSWGAKSPQLACCVNIVKLVGFGKPVKIANPGNLTPSKFSPILTTILFYHIFKKLQALFWDFSKLLFPEIFYFSLAFLTKYDIIGLSQTKGKHSKQPRGETPREREGGWTDILSINIYLFPNFFQKILDFRLTILR